MAKERINTTTSILEGIPTDTALLAEQEALDRAFAGKPKVKVTLPKAVSKSLGNPYIASYNGVVYSLIAGVPRELPEPIAEHVLSIINNTE